MDRRYLKKMRAYWAREEQRKQRHLRRMVQSPWFDHWHTHPDFKSKGNRCIEDRVAVAAIAIRGLGWLAGELATQKRAVQCWVELYQDTGSDSIWLHSENPNGTSFPRSFDSVSWDQDVPDWLQTLAPVERFEIGRRDWDDEVVYIIRPVEQRRESRRCIERAEPTG
ncbi:hypothetical protein [Stenotrophomonas sp. PD6]|uniref:hypothetical protein n=1 Tax=Stenotrophomonas sp. PD6 TaxID=3368612 RepID=UPI003BA2CB2E